MISFKDEEVVKIIKAKPLRQIKIKYLFDEAEYKLQLIEKGDWIDLRAAEDVTFKAFEHKLISLGIAMELPEGYEAYIVPRSSTYKNFGIIQANHIGIVDSSYCGDNDIWKMSAIALRDTVIHKGDRICQFRIQTTMKNDADLDFVEVNALEGKDRGGYGSTGESSFKSK